VILTKHLAAANDGTLNIAITNGTCTGLTPAPTSSNTQAGSGISNGYLTLSELRSRLAFGSSNTDKDEQLEGNINASSRWIDRYCKRRFYGVAETRYYTADDGYEITVDDLTSVSSLKTDEDGDGTFETTWATSDYILTYGENLNAALDEKPYTQIVVAENGTQTFPAHIKKGVQISGIFGYVAGTSIDCPDPIHDAAALLSERIYKRKDAPLGVAGNVTLGQQPVRIASISVDPDIMDMLAPYRRMV
jgi:hypothetical protein